MAMEAWARFSTASPNFVHICDSHMQASAIAMADSKDAILFFSYSGSTRDMCDTLQIASSRHVPVILITHFPKSAGAEFASVVLQCGYNESPLQSGSVAAKVGQLFLIDCLFYGYCSQKPDKVVMLEADNKFGKFEFRPLEPGFGVTIGNALRRILLSSLEGYAVNTIRIAGVEHEFSSVPGVKEDVTNIILNLKQVRFKQVVEEFENEKVSITVENSTEFKAGDIGKYLTGFEVLNPDLVICHLDAKASMQIDLTINKGRGYVPADENRQFCTDVNVLPIDSIYTPIRNVKYSVEPYRVEQKTDYDKLVLEITTDGSISPKDALKEAAKILIYHFMLFSDEKITLETQDQESNQEFDEEVLHMRQLLKTRLVDMNLSVRALNCLKAADVETLGDLVQFNKTDLLKFRNFGKKSLSELDDLLESLNLSFGTDISKYKLDKES